MTEGQPIADFLDAYVDAGVQLTHWWAYHTDRKSQYDMDLPFGVRPGSVGHDAVLKVFQEKNEKLREKYMINGFKYEKEAKKPYIIPLIILAVLAVGTGCFFAVKRRKKIAKN